MCHHIQTIGPLSQCTVTADDYKQRETNDFGHVGNGFPSSERVMNRIHLPRYLRVMTRDLRVPDQLVVLPAVLVHKSNFQSIRSPASCLIVSSAEENTVLLSSCIAKCCSKSSRDQGWCYIVIKNKSPGCVLKFVWDDSSRELSQGHAGGMRVASAVVALLEYLHTTPAEWREAVSACVTEISTSSNLGWSKLL